MVVYIDTHRRLGWWCICSDCYLCQQGGCTRYGMNEVRIAHPNAEELIAAERRGDLTIKRVVFTAAERELIAREWGGVEKVCRL